MENKPPPPPPVQPPKIVAVPRIQPRTRRQLRDKYRSPKQPESAFSMGFGGACGCMAAVAFVVIVTTVTIFAVAAYLAR